MNPIQYPAGHEFSTGTAYNEVAYYITRERNDERTGGAAAFSTSGQSLVCEPQNASQHTSLEWRRAEPHGFCLLKTVSRVEQYTTGNYTGHRYVDRHCYFVEFPSGKVLEDLGPEPAYDAPGSTEYRKRTDEGRKEINVYTDRQAKFAFDDRHVVLLGAGAPFWLEMLVGQSKATETLKGIKGVKSKHLIIYNRFSREAKVLKVEHHPLHIMLYDHGNMLICLGRHGGCIIDLD